MWMDEWKIKTLCECLRMRKERIADLSDTVGPRKAAHFHRRINILGFCILKEESCVKCITGPGCVSDANTRCTCSWRDVGNFREKMKFVDKKSNIQQIKIIT